MNTTAASFSGQQKDSKESSLLSMEEQWKSILLEIDKIQKVPFSNDKMDNIWDVSANEIEEQWEICYMNPCIGLSLLLIKKLKSLHRPEDISLGVESLKYPDGNMGFHFFVEVNNEGESYVIDYSHDNKVLLYPGNYRNQNTKYQISSLNIMKIPAYTFKDSDSIFAIAQNTGMDVSSIKKLLQGHIEKLKHDNTPQQWNDFNEKRNKSIEIRDQNYFFEEIQKRLLWAFQVDKQTFYLQSSTIKENVSKNRRRLLQLLEEQESQENTVQIIDCLVNSSPTYSPLPAHFQKIEEKN